MSTDPVFGPPRGMRDFYPADMALRDAIFQAWTTAARRAGFEPYDACVVESLELLKRKGGEEIVDQIYAFTDKSQRELALRAEMTPTLARMIAARQNELALPLKWFAIAQCFRYERTARGRKREHYQWNLDIVGEPALEAEAEVIAAAVGALNLLGLTAQDVQVHLNSRALLADLFLRLGIPRVHHAAIFLALDKRGKVADDAIAAILREAGLDDRSIAAAFQVLSIASLDEAAALLAADTPALADLRACLQLFAAYGLTDYIVFDISVIRGLGYYTGIVFEGHDRRRELRAIFGGGRYDNLLSDLGGKPLTAVGLGFGDVVIGELLLAKGWQVSGAMRDVAVGYMEAAQSATAIAVAQALRRQSLSVDLALHPEKPKSFFGRAGAGSFRHAIYLGPDDVAKGVVRIKELATRTEREAPLDTVLTKGWA
jgi:histidyl-tRNA synthetase